MRIYRRMCHTVEMPSVKRLDAARYATKMATEADKALLLEYVPALFRAMDAVHASLLDMGVGGVVEVGVGLLESAPHTGTCVRFAFTHRLHPDAVHVPADASAIAAECDTLLAAFAKDASTVTRPPEVRVRVTINRRARVTDRTHAVEQQRIVE